MNLMLAALVVLTSSGSLTARVDRMSDGSRVLLGSIVLRQTDSNVTGLRTLSIPHSDTKVVVWDEGSSSSKQQFYAVTGRDGSLERVATSSGELRLRAGSFDPLKGVPTVPSSLKARDGNEMFVVQFVSQPLEEYRSMIQAAGGVIENYLPDNAYVVQVPPQRIPEIRAMPFVRWVGPLEPAWRLDESLVAGIAHATLTTAEYNVQIAGDDRVRKQAVARDIQALGGVVLACPDAGTIMEVRLEPKAVPQVAAVNGLLFMDLKGRPEPDMNNVRAITGADTIQAVAGYSGQGVNAQVIDGGFRATHQDFVGHVTVRNNSSDTSHGSSTTGIVFGSGKANGQGKGMLPDAQGVFTTYSTGWTGAQRLSLTQDTVNTYHCVIESNSWGDSLTGSYTTISSYMDEIIFKTDLLICQSMSNYGNNSSVRPQAWAKNIVSIGGVYHIDNQNLADDRWNSGASTGPAADGRMKPELCFYYDSIFCPTNTSDTAYTTGFSGTSAATPMSAGCFGLFYQMWGDGIFGNTCLGATVFDNRAHSSTARAMVINQAMTYPNTQNDIERRIQGWGLPNVQNIYDVRNSTFVVDESDLLQNMQSKTYRLYVAPGTPSFKATLDYTDYWAAPNANPTRVNTLTLHVTDPTGIGYYGNNGMLATTDAPNVTAAGGGADTRNTLQNVWINNPQPGVWTVTVSADALVQDGHTETTEMDADFGLVVSGVVSSILPSTLSSYKPLSIVSGGITELAKSDNSYVALRAPLQATNQAYVQSGVVVTGQSPVANPTRLNLVAEGESNLSNVHMKVLYWNYAIGDYELVSDTAATSGDSAVNADGTGDLSRFVDQATGEVKAAVYFERNQTLPAQTSWASKLDHTRWFVNP